jgi:valyl-tRNA synthetase
MALLQEMITAARKLRADHGLDRKLVLNGVLYCRNGSQQVELGVIEKLANVKLDIRNEVAPKLEGAVRSTPDFDLLLELPEVDSGAQRGRLAKEIEQLEKLIVDKDRQLANDKFLSSAPPHVVDSLRAKRAEYVAQLEKSRAVLADLR